MEDSDSPTSRYAKFDKSTQELAKEILPKAPKGKRMYLPENPQMIKARCELEQASEAYLQKRNKPNRLAVKEKKKALKEAHEELEEKVLSDRIEEINKAHANQQHAEALKLINDIAGRKQTPAGKLNAKSQEERKIFGSTISANYWEKSQHNRTIPS